MRVKMEVLGEMNVRNYLSIPDRLNRKRAFTRAGLYVEHSARMKSPYKTGHLRRNIVATATDEYAEVGVDLNVVPYAWYQEAGTSKMQAHPYLRPGLEASRQAIVAIFKDEINQATKGAKR